jgi:tRNA/tmRNA/rRNA uracil-C5-methylase (TrmA/RlmC/RlmD family)
MADKNIKKKAPLKPDKENSYISRLVFESGIKLSGPEPLASMDYLDELRCKDRAFSSYWYEAGGGWPVAPVVESPLPRHYRTTTKRRVHKKGGNVILSSDEFSINDQPSLLEPEFHSFIYSKISVLLNDSKNSRLSEFLNFVILRGNYDSVAVIFNVRVMNGEVVNSLTKIAVFLREVCDKMDGAYIYHDPEGSKYYLNISSEVEGPRMKRLFGNRNLSIKVNDIIYTFAPEGFSQVNLSICPAMLNTAKRLLKHDGKGRLLDLYCGYGFFSCFLSEEYEEVTGIDYGETAIDSARENMKRIKARSKWEFHAKRIDRKSLAAILQQSRFPEYLILDPPRNGTAQGVIETLAARNPELVLHIFCGLETIPYELEKWEKGGYCPAECIPLDMFPGTPDLEVMILFKKISGYGKRKN